MKSLGRACLGLWMVGSALAFVACGDDDDGGPGGAGAPSAGAPGAGGGAGEGAGPVASGEAKCQVLGELCHAADTGSGPISECHELGHVNDADACTAGFADCIEACVPESGGEEPLCAALGELCHDVDDEDGPLSACHELGHVNDAAICAAEFDHCAEICLKAREDLEHGAGGAGAGGASHGHGGAPHTEGGAAHGGAR